MRLSTRSRQAALMVRPAFRTIRWPALGVIAAIAFLIVYGALHSTEGIHPLHVFGAQTLLAVWVGFLLDDPTAETTASLPFPLVVRRAVRIAVALPVVLAIWGSLAWYADVGPETRQLAAAMVAQVVGALALAAFGARAAGHERAGQFAGAALFVVFFAIPLALRWPLMPPPPPETWAHLYGRWVVIGVVGLSVFLVASADPARPRPLGTFKLRFARPPAVAEQAR